ncbi:MAG TPA: hypothetical protein VGK48_10530 [Terriglobia bacterium]|jgi:hypothetical protein
MKLLLCAFILAVSIPLLSFGQTIQTGFAVVTPTSGTGAGLSISEIFGEQVDGNFFQSSVIASPLVTLTDVVINSNPGTGVNTGIAIVNPNNTPATVTLTLGNEQGVTADTRTLTLGAHQQISRFITELFSGNSLLTAPLTGLVFISSNVPVGVLGLSFTGFSFTSLPVATQLSAGSVPATGTTTVQTGIAVAPVTIAQQINPIPTTISQLPATFPGLEPTPLPTTVTTPITGVAPVTSLAPITGVTPVTSVVPITVIPVPGTTTTLTGTTGTITTTATSVPTTIPVLSPSVIAFPQLMLNVGGPGAQLLPQVATGAGWVSQITIANLSGVAQVVRIDFFTPNGAPLTLPSGSTAQNIAIAPGGVTTISTVQ